MAEILLQYSYLLKQSSAHRSFSLVSTRPPNQQGQFFVMTGAVDFKLIKREFIAGGTAGGIGIFLGFPFDLIKVNLQTHPDKFTSAWQCFKQIVKTEGYGGLYRGCIPPVMMQGLINSLIFTGESVATKILEPNLRPGEVASPLNSFLAGSAGGLLQCVILVPSEVIKCTMQAGSLPHSVHLSSASNAFTPTLDTIKYIYRTEGVGGLYKGLGVTCLREIPAIGIYFFTYKNLRQKFHSMQGGTAQTPVSTPATLVAGALAGAASWLLLYPIDVVKTNMQAAVAPSASASAAEVKAFKDMNLWNVTVNLYKTRGPSVFFRGVGTAVFRSLPVNAVVFYLYEKIKPQF